LQISKDLALTPGFSPLMNKVAVWMVAINPLTKIAMGLKPVSAMCQELRSPTLTVIQLADVMNSILHITPTRLVTPIPVPAPTPAVPGTPIDRRADENTPLNFPINVTTRPSYTGILDEQATLQAHAKRWQRRERYKGAARQGVLIMLAVASVLAALLFPSFEFVLALLGSGFAFVTCAVIPYWAGMKVLGCTWYDTLGLAFSAFVAVVGTIAACIN
jgi:vesicular inhibitory amino acid transporter